MPLPAFIPVSTALSRGARYAGELAPEALAGLEGLARPVSPLSVTLGFERARGESRVRGTVNGTLLLVCERCEAAYERALSLELALRLVQSEEEEREALADADPWRVEEDRIPVASLVEQEVLLDLPVIRRCPACEAALAAEAAKPSAAAPTHRPFAALRPK